MKEIRKSTGMTQAEFAKYLTVPLRTLQSWETGERKPSQYIKNLAKRVVELEGKVKED